MSIPTSGNVLGSKIRQDLYGSAGTFSLNSNESRDAIKKPSGDISYSDFRGWAWGSGRTLVRTLNQGVGVQKPHTCDGRSSGSSSGSNNFSVGLSGNLPVWSSNSEVFNHNTAPGELDLNGYFYCDKLGQEHTVTYTVERTKSGNEYTEGYLYILQFSSGYLQGSRTLIAQYPNWPIGTSNITQKFTPQSYAGPHVVLVFCNWHDAYVNGIPTYQTISVKTAKVTVP